MIEKTEYAKHVEYANNISLNGNTRLAYEDVAKIRDYLEKCEQEFKKSISANSQTQETETPVIQMSNDQPIYRIYIRKGNRQFEFFSFNELFETAKSKEELAQVDNIQISHQLVGINVTVDNNYAQVNCWRNDIGKAQNCAISILSIITSKLKAPFRRGQAIISIIATSLFVVTPMVAVAFLPQQNLSWILILIIPLLYIRNCHRFDYMIYSKFINKGSVVELIPDIKGHKSNKRQKTLNTVSVIFSLIGGSAILKFVFDLVMDWFSK